jgi:hypothetical protein
MRPILYLSGPYTPANGRTTEQHIAVARAHAEAAWRQGWAAFCPHLNCAGFEVTCPDVSHEEWLAGDLAILKHLEPGCDAMLVLPNWEQSAGTNLEVGMGEAHRVDDPRPVRYGRGDPRAEEVDIMTDLRLPAHIREDPPATPEEIPPAAAFRRRCW